MSGRHTVACGTPSAVTHEAADLYIGYFANRYGEQWIFTFDRATHHATLQGADVDWGHAHAVLDGRGLVLAPEEAAWLQVAGALPARSRIPPSRGPVLARRVRVPASDFPLYRDGYIVGRDLLDLPEWRLHLRAPANDA